MKSVPDADLEEYLAAIAVAQDPAGPRRGQSRPRRTCPTRTSCGSARGRRRRLGGGVLPLTPDQRQPGTALAAAGAPRGTHRRSRTRTARTPRRRSRIYRGAARGRHARSSRTGGLTGHRPRRRRAAGGQAVAGSRRGRRARRTDLHTAIDREGRLTTARGDFDNAFGDWQVLADQVSSLPAGARTSGPERLDRDVADALRAAERDPAGITMRRRWRWPMRTVRSSTRCAGSRTRSAGPQSVTPSPTWSTGTSTSVTSATSAAWFCVFASGDRRGRLPAVAGRGRRPGRAGRAVGATEVAARRAVSTRPCPSSVHHDLARAVKGRCPDMHLHAFSPMDIYQRRVPDGHSSCPSGWPAARGGAGLRAGHRGGDPRRRDPLDPDQGQAPRRGVDPGEDRDGLAFPPP